MKRKSKISGHIIRSGAAAVFFFFALIGLSPAFNFAPKPAAPSRPALSTSNQARALTFAERHQRVSGREIAGFSARQARTGQEEEMTPPAGLKPVEQEAWLAMARRQGASGTGLERVYPARY